MSIELKSKGAKVHPNIKALAGTARADRDGLSTNQLKVAETNVAIFPSVMAVPEPPVWMTHEHALEEWYRLSALLINVRILDQAALSALAILCSIHGDLVTTLSKNVRGRRPLNPSLLAQYRALVNDFGLTPMSRLKVRNDKTEGKENAFAKNGQQGRRKPPESGD
jgi:phage terminase small subunit